MSYRFSGIGSIRAGSAYSAHFPDWPAARYVITELLSCWEIIRIFGVTRSFLSFYFTTFSYFRCYGLFCDYNKLDGQTYGKPECTTSAMGRGDGMMPITNLIIYSPKAIIVPHRIIRSWYSGSWWVGCYIRYSEEGPGLAEAMPSSLLAGLTAHPSTASVPVTVLLYDGPLLYGFNVTIKELSTILENEKLSTGNLRSRERDPSDEAHVMSTRNPSDIRSTHWVRHHDVTARSIEDTSSCRWTFRLHLTLLTTASILIGWTAGGLCRSILCTSAAYRVGQIKRAQCSFFRRNKARFREFW